MWSACFLLASIVWAFIFYLALTISNAINLAAAADVIICVILGFFTLLALATCFLGILGFLPPKHQHTSQSDTQPQPTAKSNPPRTNKSRHKNLYANGGSLPQKFHTIIKF